MNKIQVIFLTCLLAVVVGVGTSGMFSAATAVLSAASQPTLARAEAPVVNVQAAAPAPHAAAPTDAPLLDATGVVRQANPAIVTVVNQLSRGMATGSGFITDQQGHIVTNNHVIDGAQALQVIFYDGRQANAQLVGTDPGNDIAVIQVSAGVPGTVTWGDSSRLEAGQPVVAIGSALGDFANTVTVGVVSGLNRRIGGADAGTGFIQTDAAINHGNSGGPLLNMNAEVIGVNTLVVRDASSGDQAEGLGFAIPANTAHAIADQLMQNGSVVRPYLGVSYQTLTPPAAADRGITPTSGAYLSDVQAGSPAAQAGLRPGDVITTVDGQALTETATLGSLLLQHQPGDRVPMQVIHANTPPEVTVSVTLGRR
jgi:2-alkenal reductase